MHHLIKFSTVMFLFFIACSSPEKNENEGNAGIEQNADEIRKHTPKKIQTWDEFWPAFNSAVQNNDTQSVAQMTAMPLKGHPHGDLDAEHFASHFNDIFDQKAKEVFAKATAKDFNDITVTNTEQAAVMNIEPNTDVRILGIHYKSGKEEKAKNKTSVIFNFGVIDGKYKLLSMMQAG